MSEYSDPYITVTASLTEWLSADNNSQNDFVKEATQHRGLNNENRLLRVCLTENIIRNSVEWYSTLSGNRQALKVVASIWS